MEEKMRLKGIPIIDTHCHPFDPTKGSEDFRLDFNISHWGVPAEMLEHTLLNHKMIRELSKLLELSENTTQEEVVVERNKQYRSDPKKYVYKLFNAVNLDTLLVDTGYPHEEFTDHHVELNDFKKIVPCKVYQIYRIAPTIYRIFENLPSTFDEVCDIIDKDMENALKIDKVIGFKSIIAYETGLEIKMWSDKEAREAYNRFKIDRNKDDEKIIRDYFTIVGLDKCRENDIPMQFHTGMGSVPILDLQKANPILMQDILSVDRIRETKVVITHSGHPFIQETGMLVSCFPNLYCDVSAISPYFGTALRQAFLKLFEMAPMNKIMYGTDGGTMPETYWFGALQGIKDLESALTEMVRLDWFDAGKAMEFAHMIIRNNAIKFYKL
jgi:hypothetical protein